MIVQQRPSQIRISYHSPRNGSDKRRFNVTVALELSNDMMRVGQWCSRVALGSDMIRVEQ